MDSVRVHCADKKILNSCQWMVAITVSQQGFCLLLEEVVHAESSSRGSSYHPMTAVTGAKVIWFLVFLCGLVTFCFLSIHMSLSLSLSLSLYIYIYKKDWLYIVFTGLIFSVLYIWMIFIGLIFLVYAGLLKFEFTYHIVLVLFNLIYLFLARFNS